MLRKVASEDGISALSLFRGIACAGQTALIRTCASALARHPLCLTHVVWINCGDVDSETLGKAKAYLLPLVSCWSANTLPLTCCFLLILEAQHQQPTVNQG